MPPPSTEQSFRANLSQFRWARGANDDTQQQQQTTTQPGNPFSRFYNAVAGDYIPLRSNEQSNEDEAWFALSRWERCVLWFNSVIRLSSMETLFRLLGFGGCLIGAAICFVFAFFTLPFLAIRYVLFIFPYVFHDPIHFSRPAKFALAFRYVP
jgi:hypothetical protein